MSKKVLFFLMFFTLIIMIVAPINKIDAKQNDLNKLDLSLSPIDLSFNLSNMKPGDWLTRELTVFNNSTEDFYYNTSVQLLSGSEKLYNELSFIVKDSNSELYNGKLSEFKGLSPRSLSRDGNESLTFTVEFPTHLGNEYQGLSSEIVFKFYVDRTVGVVPLDGTRLPETATNLYNILFLGGILFITGLIINYVLEKRRVMY
ncbi:cell wall protein [Bacillus weihaiensis]|uniref:cell wall protein n=1 Tax=Bacillus weihaiensis TaxID=1547283 RepID=UPI002353741A|nr:cell wall protein [Bacillus weihaiensis]